MIDYNLNEQFEDLVQRILGEQESNNNNSNKDKTTKKTTMCQSKAQIPFKIVTLNTRNYISNISYARFT